MGIEAGSWYELRHGSGLAWTWAFHALDLAPFPTIVYSPTFVPACYLNPDWPSLNPTDDPAEGMKLIVVFHADHATNFTFQYRIGSGSWHNIFSPPLIFGSFDYGNCFTPYVMPTLTSLRVEMSGATGFHSILDGVVTLYTR